MNLRPRVVLTLLAALFLLASPAVASATVYEVNTKADEGDKNPGAPCETNAGAGVCSLRAAIEVANSTAAVSDTILFKASVFNGQLSTSTIEPSTSFPTIASPLEINGATCGSPAGPCVGISGPSGSTAFTVTAESSSIFDLAIADASTAIRVEAKKFTARGNWFGVDLEGEPGTAGTFGIALSPNADEATVGGTQKLHRNVFANSGTGLQLRGASKAVVQGNYFGVLPDGETAAPNTRNLVVADALGPLPNGTPATNNLIGADVGTAGSETAACDEGCNVFAATTSTEPAIDLQGKNAFEEKAATGPTTIRGNFVGLDATGTGELPNPGYGILAAGADHVTIGGATAGTGNYLIGGGEAIFSGNDGNDFNALGNSIGFRADGTAATASTGKGIYVVAVTAPEGPEIENNEIRVGGASGIEVSFRIGRIIGNDVEGGTTGILVGFGEGGGLIAGNSVESPSSTGILVESSDNEVRRNTILDAGGAGIAVEPPPGVTPTTGNLIGGNNEERENAIEGSAGAAIEIVEEAGEPGSWTEIARNHGGGNGGLFIDLVTGANQGIVPPVISSATQTKAEGTSKPNAMVRLFRKATASPGEVEAFLAETEADGSGKWSVAYGSVPAGTNLAATQTEEEVGTSELALATAAADPSNGGGGNNGGGNGGGNGGKPKDKTPPDTKILKGPPKKTHKRTVKYKFVSTEAGSTFQCRLDRKPFKPCASPKKYKKLKPGNHVFRVRAIDKAGNVDPTPAKRKFTVLKK